MDNKNAAHDVAGKNSPIKAVLWDIDGTLIDSEFLHYQVIADWCKGRGYILREEDNEQLLGKSMREKWDILTTLHNFHSNAVSFSKECSTSYRDALRRTMARPEPLETLRRISALEISQVCVSNGDRSVVEANLAVLGITDLISFSITGEDVSHGKPHPQPYTKALQRLGLLPKDCLAVEDSPVGLESAINAGIPTVAWPIRNENHSELDYKKASFIVSEIDDFPWQLFL